MSGDKQRRSAAHDLFLRNLLLFISVLVLFGCATTHHTNRTTKLAASSSPAVAAGQDQSDAINRPTR